MLPQGVTLACVFDQVEPADGHGFGEDWIDLDRFGRHQQGAIVRRIAAYFSTGDVNLTRAIFIEHASV